MKILTYATLADGQDKYTKESLAVLRKSIDDANILFEDTTDTLTEGDINLAVDAVMKALRSLRALDKEIASPALNINVSYSKIENRTYTGKAIKPGITVKIGSTALKKGRDYTLSYKNNKNVGTATVVITGKGDYKGTVKKTFKILPKGTSLTRLNPKKKGCSIRWKKNTKQTTGYQIQYSLKKNFSGAKSKNIGNKVTSLNLRKLKGRKRYYVRIRTYKKIKGKKYYSAWSKSKTVVTRR